MDADAISQCSEKEILEAVQQLTPAYRVVFNLYVIEGYSHKEIGEILNISETTSRSQLARARKMLQQKNRLQKLLLLPVLIWIWPQVHTLRTWWA